jgi:hypothetical protein
VDYLIPGMLGFLIGAILFGLTYSSVYPAISGIANLGNIYLPDLFDVNHWLLIVLLALISLYLFYVLGKTGDPRTSES